MSGKYDDIIDLPHPEPQTHPRMPMRDRAAQFAPFAALTGHRAALAETERRAADAAESENERFSEPEPAAQSLYSGTEYVWEERRQYRRHRAPTKRQETKQPSGRLVSFLYEAPLVGAAAPPNGRRRNSASEAAEKQRKRHG